MGAEIVGIGADDLEEISDAEADGEYYKLGAEAEHFKDYASLALKPDHANRCGARLPCLPLAGTPRRRRRPPSKGHPTLQVG